jgi:hypothetical protein
MDPGRITALLVWKSTNSRLVRSKMPSLWLLSKVVKQIKPVRWFVGFILSLCSLKSVIGRASRVSRVRNDG